MDKITKEALFSTSNLSKEALSKRRNINLKIFKFGCLPILIFFGLLYIIASYTTSNSGESKFKEAQQYLADKKYHEGIKAINIAIRKDSARTDFYELRGKLLQEVQDTIHSKEDFEKTVKLSQNDSIKNQRILELIEWQLKKGDTAEVKKLLLEEVMLYKTDSIKHIQTVEYAASTFLAIGDTIHAIQLFSHLEDQYPLQGRFKNQKGVLFSLIKKNNFAIPLFKEAIQIEPKNDQYYYNLGISYLNIKNKTKARKFFKQSMELGNKEACYEYRELIARTRYYQISRCCDGTSSNSVGRGACSHHNGVCRIENVPYKEYTMTCN